MGCNLVTICDDILADQNDINESTIQDENK